jgi:hypothetical protein
VKILFCYCGLHYVPKLGKAANEHKAWAKQTYLNVTGLLVPDGLKMFKERSAIAARSEAVLVGNGGVVSCYSRSTGGYTQNSVELAKKECSCGNWQLYQYPCACAIAVAVKQGLMPEQFVQANCHDSYHICAERLEQIAGRLKTILAPSTEQLRTVRK